jgi:serine/threonine-protein kinase
MASEPNDRKEYRRIRLGRYRLLAHIAKGGMGTVYKAFDTELKRDVALKVLPPSLAANHEALERFRREAHHAARLRHENIVTIYELGLANELWFLALEFIDGPNLRDYLAERDPLDPEEARRVTIQACLALHHAHERGVVHRDVKPSNLLLGRKEGGRLIKLSDLGLSRLMEEKSLRLTRTGSAVGTANYISPEQVRGSVRVDARSDIYSLGCTLYHMLAGRPPFVGGSVAERLAQHLNAEPPDVRRFNAAVPLAMLVVLRRMLAKAPEKRYQTAAALLRDLIDLDTYAFRVV